MDLRNSGGYTIHMVDRSSRRGALVPYNRAIRHLVLRAIPADPTHPSVALLAEIYDTDETTVAQDMAAMLDDRHRPS